MSDAPRPGYWRHTLAHPVVKLFCGADGEERSETITYLDIREQVKGKDMRATDKADGPMGKQLALIASLSGQPASVIDEMDQADITAIMDRNERPTPPGLQTGDAPSD